MLKIVDSEELFKGETTVQIRHENVIYILRITKGNKLILTK